MYQEKDKKQKKGGGIGVGTAVAAGVLLENVVYEHESIILFTQAVRVCWEGCFSRKPLSIMTITSVNRAIRMVRLLSDFHEGLL